MSSSEADSTSMTAGENNTTSGFDVSSMVIEMNATRFTSNPTSQQQTSTTLITSQVMNDTATWNLRTSSLTIFATSPYEISSSTSQLVASDTTSPFETTQFNTSNANSAPLLPLPLIIGVCVGGVVALLVIVSVIVLVVRRRSIGRGDTIIPEEDTDNIYSEPSFTPDHKRDENAAIAFYQLRISDHRQMFGCFGKVTKAEVRFTGQTIPVAVKTLKHAATEWEKTNFQEVLEMTRKTGQHPNIVCLIASVKDPNIDDMLMILDGGKEDLNCYLDRLKRQSLSWNFTISMRKLLRISCDVAKGMVHLALTEVPHSFLSAETIIMDHNHTAKISGFVSFGNDLDSLQLLHRQVPLRWAAPETFLFNHHTFMGDVWSFGILLWEIFSLGDIPYTEVESMELYDTILGGFRLRRTRTMSDTIYILMNKCWHREASQRPTFLSLLTEIEDILANLVELEKPDMMEYEEIDEFHVSQGHQDSHGTETTVL